MIHTRNAVKSSIGTQIRAFSSASLRLNIQANETGSKAEQFLKHQGKEEAHEPMDYDGQAQTAVRGALVDDEQMSKKFVEDDDVPSPLTWAPTRDAFNKPFND